MLEAEEEVKVARGNLLVGAFSSTVSMLMVQFHHVNNRLTLKSVGGLTTNAASRVQHFQNRV